MQFNDWTTIFAYYRNRAAANGMRHHPMFRSVETFYDANIKDVFKQGKEMDYGYLHTEHLWYEDKRPYYNVYPGIVPMLTGLKLTIPVQEINPPMRVLLVRLPINNNPVFFEHDGDNYHLRSILFSVFNIETTTKTQFEAWLDIGERGESERPVRCLGFSGQSNSLLSKDKEGRSDAQREAKGEE